MVHLCEKDETVDTVKVLVEGLEQLRTEHIALRKGLEVIQKQATAIGCSADKADWRKDLTELRSRMDQFMGQMEGHSAWEDDVLFPLVADYVGREKGPLAVMEHEHELAEQNVSRFHHVLEASEEAPIPGEQAKDAASFILQAYVILMDHFQKEEDVLFPLAEQMVTDLEQFFS